MGYQRGRKPRRTVPLTVITKIILREVGQTGGKARADKLSPERQREIAITASSAAAEARSQRARDLQAQRDSSETRIVPLQVTRPEIRGPESSSTHTKEVVKAPGVVSAGGQLLRRTNTARLLPAATRRNAMLAATLRAAKIRRRMLASNSHPPHGETSRKLPITPGRPPG
jgi:hypothetical protein